VGIGVILDVVYNHTAPRAGFEQLAPGYYFARHPRRFCNGSGCGNRIRQSAAHGPQIHPRLGAVLGDPSIASTASASTSWALIDIAP